MIATEQFDCLSVDQVRMMLGDKKLREYPVFKIQRGHLTKKKIKYVNLEQTSLKIRVESERTDICTIKEKQLEIKPKDHDFIRLRILVPNNIKDNFCKFDVTLYNTETNLIHEILQFNFIIT